MNNYLKIVNHILAASVALFGSFAAAQAIPPAAKATKSTTPPPVMRDAFSLMQKSQLVGEFDVTITDKALMARNRKQSMSIYCTAPFKDVVMFSDRTRKYYVMPFANFRCPVNKALTAINAGLLSDTPVEKHGETTYKKNKVTTYRSTPAFTKRQVARFKNQEVPGRGPHDYTCYTTDNPKVDERLVSVIYRFYGLPVLPGFPLYAEFIDLGGDKNLSLTTEKMVKTKVDDSLFKLPPQYARAAKTEDLYVSNDTADEMELMIAEPK